MVKKPDRKPRDDPEQSRRFEETARELKTDTTTGAAFKKAIKIVVVPAKEQRRR